MKPREEGVEFDAGLDVDCETYLKSLAVDDVCVVAVGFVGFVGVVFVSNAHVAVF